MNAQETDRILKEAWGWLVAMTKGDEEAATDALPWVWKFSQEEDFRLTRRILKRALFQGRNHGLWGMRPGGGYAKDALPGASRLPRYCVPSHRFPNPARHATVREAVRLVYGLANTTLKWQTLQARLLGCVTRDSAKVPGHGHRSVRCTFRRLRAKARATYPSLIGGW